MAKEKVIINLKLDRTGSFGFPTPKKSYVILATKENQDIPNKIIYSQARKMDKRFLLVEHIPGQKEKIFGIADTLEEAEKRIYNKALEIVKDVREAYSKEYSTEFTDETCGAKSIESKL